MQANITITLRDMISAKELPDAFDEDDDREVWAVYFLGVEIARESEYASWPTWDEEMLKDKYEEILGEKLAALLGMGDDQK